MDELIHTFLDIFFLPLADGLPIDDPLIFGVMLIIALCFSGTSAVAIPAVVISVMSDGDVNVEYKQ